MTPRFLVHRVTAGAGARVGAGVPSGRPVMVRRLNETTERNPCPPAHKPPEPAPRSGVSGSSPGTAASRQEILSRGHLLPDPSSVP
jgi:hypothetical protein